LDCAEDGGKRIGEGREELELEVERNEGCEMMGGMEKGERKPLGRWKRWDDGRSASEKTWK
jgi:hypothetical protein